MSNSSKRIGLIAGHSGDALTDKLQERGYEVFLIAGKEGEPGTGTANSVLVTDLKNKEHILDYFMEHDIKKIMIGTGNVLTLNLVKYLEDNGLKTSLDYKKSLLAKDKVLFKEKLIELGFQTPKFLSFKGKNQWKKAIDEIGLPCVVKSATDVVQPCKANTISELTEAVQCVLDNDSEVLIEEFIDGIERTIPIVSTPSKLEVLGVINYCKSSEYLLKGFDKAKPEEINAEMEAKVKTTAIDLVQRLGFNGLLRLDIIMTHRVNILELNSVVCTGYQCSSYPFFLKSGFNIADQMVITALEILEVHNG